MKTPQTFAAALLMHRERLGLTQEEIAERLAMPRRTWQNYERGERTPETWVQTLILSRLAGLRRAAG